MAEMNDSKAEKKEVLQDIVDKVKDTSEKVVDKVGDVISDVKNSEFGEKVSDVAQKIGEKAKDMVQDVKEGEYAGKIGEVFKDLVSRAKVFGGKILEKLGTVAGIPTLKNAGEKLREKPEDTSMQEDKLDELDKIVAVIIEDGVITPEEEELLRKKALELELDAETLLAEVRAKISAKA